MTPVAPIPARKYGRMYGGDRPWITDTGLQVWMWRKGQKVRFLTATGKQIGPTHANVYPAMLYAADAGWIDTSSVALSLACIAEIRSRP